MAGKAELWSKSTYEGPVFNIMLTDATPTQLRKLIKGSPNSALARQIEEILDGD